MVSLSFILWVDEWMDGWINGFIDGWTIYGPTKRIFYLYFISLPLQF